MEKAPSPGCIEATSLSNSMSPWKFSTLIAGTAVSTP